MGAGTAISALTEGAELRTWSLIVTIFGDLARAPRAEIPGPVLSAITARIGVKPEAMRVALHRLRKDNWLTSRRDGRVSHYLLTDVGRAESEKATGRIYATRPSAPETWHLLIAGPMDPAERLERDAAMAASGHLALAPGVWLGPGRTHRPAPGLFTIEGVPGQVPGWLKAEIMPPALAEAYAAFGATMATAANALGTDSATSALDRAALRVLVVHGWRRLVLRHPDLPDGFFPDGWAGPETRTQVTELLARLGKPTVAEIATSLAEA